MQGPMVEKCCYNKILMSFFGGREDEDKRRDRMVKLDFFSFQSCPFETILKNQHILFSVHGHTSWSTFGLHLLRGPKTL